MEVLPGPVAVLSGPEVGVLGRQLADAIRLGYVARGAAPPLVLLEFAVSLNRAARASASSASVPTSGAVAELRNTWDEALWPSSGQPVMLTVAEAARMAEVSQRWVRTAIQRGSLEALRGRRGAWLIRIDSLNAWIDSRRRKEDDHREAA